MSYLTENRSKNFSLVNPSDRPELILGIKEEKRRVLFSRTKSILEASGKFSIDEELLFTEEMLGCVPTQEFQATLMALKVLNLASKGSQLVDIKEIEEKETTFTQDIVIAEEPS